MLPKSSERYGAGLAREQRTALASVSRSWGRMTPEFDGAWLAVRPSVVGAVSQAQENVAVAAGLYVPSVLAETGQRVRDLEYEPSVSAWTGTAGDGRRVDALARGAVVKSKRAIAAGATDSHALRVGGLWLSMAMGTVLADTARGAEQVHMAARHVGGYARMLNGPHPCGRCIVLAGRIYATREAFKRHPGCLCIHIPASESVATDAAVNPAEFLDQLDDDDLARALGSKANAQAYRDGADQSQLVNAYRRKGGVRKAQVYGRDVRITGEGMTRRGVAGKAARGAGVRAPRLMPSTIYETAKDRVDAQRLLKMYGWIL